MRKPHYLKLNKGVELPTRCIFLDTETDATQIDDKSELHTLRLGEALYKRRFKGDHWTAGEWLDFTDIDSIWEWVESKTPPGSKLYLYAHNLIYDLTVLKGIAWMTSHGWTITKAIIDDPPTAIAFRKDRKTIMMLDSFNYFRSSLASIGESIGYPKLKMPPRHAESQIWQIYCRRDVEVLADAMISYFTFLDTNSLGNYQITLASQAFTAFRHRFMGDQIFIDGNEKALDLARRAYHGGRTEAFYIGSETGQYYTLDVNSMYPAVMATDYYPTKLWTVCSRLSLSELSDYLKQYCLISLVDIETDQPVYPVFSGGKLLFPIGKFQTVLSSPELEFALSQGHVKRSLKTAIYARSKIFHAYVYELYRLRRAYQEAGNQTFSWLCKIMLNSLYGKWGQLGRVYEEIGETDPSEVRVWREWDADTKTMHSMRSFGGIVQELTAQGESYNSHPAIAAHVTASARMQLWRLMSRAGLDNVYYVDTDSLTVNKAGLRNIPSWMIGTDLGSLKMEHSFKRMTIYGAKDYQFGNKRRIKGIREKALELSPGVFVQDRFSKFKSMLRAGDLERMVIYKQEKTLSRIYDKGIVIDSGRVMPITMPDDRAYQKWLDKRYADRYKYGANDVSDQVDPKDRWMVIQDDLDVRRAGESIYQR